MPLFCKFKIINTLLPWPVAQLVGALSHTLKGFRYPPQSRRTWKATSQCLCLSSPLPLLFSPLPSPPLLSLPPSLPPSLKLIKNIPWWGIKNLNTLLSAIWMTWYVKCTVNIAWRHSAVEYNSILAADLLLSILLL